MLSEDGRMWANYIYNPSYVYVWSSVPQISGLQSTRAVRAHLRNSDRKHRKGMMGRV